jgi:hypothetical protein
MIFKRICIKEIEFKQLFTSKLHRVKFGEQFEYELSEWGPYCSKINGIELDMSLSMSQLNKFSAKLQDIRNIKLLILTNDYTANKRLKKKILAAQKMNDYQSMLKHISKSNYNNGI